MGFGNDEMMVVDNATVAEEVEAMVGGDNWVKMVVVVVIPEIHTQLVVEVGGDGMIPVEGVKLEALHMLEVELLFWECDAHESEEECVYIHSLAEVAVGSKCGNSVLELTAPVAAATHCVDRGVSGTLQVVAEVVHCVDKGENGTQQVVAVVVLHVDREVDGTQLVEMVEEVNVWVQRACIQSVVGVEIDEYLVKPFQLAAVEHKNGNCWVEEVMAMVVIRDALLEGVEVADVFWVRPFQ